jgi:Tfp pilus assembly protein PilF
VVGLTPLAAAQHYRAYAEKCLTEASQGHPWFSELYYCIGRTLQAQGDSDKGSSDALMQQALTYYRSAHAIQPVNANNANQLGYVLLRMDRPREAFVQLSEAVRLPNCPLEGWQNLVQASSRLGDQRTAQWAAQNYAALRAQGKESSAPTGTLVEVDPRQFAALSPYASGPRPSMMPTQPPAAQPPAQSQAQAPPARTASAPATGFFR